MFYLTRLCVQFMHKTTQIMQKSATFTPKNVVYINLEVFYSKLFYQYLQISFFFLQKCRIGFFPLAKFCLFSFLTFAHEFVCTASALTSQFSSCKYSSDHEPRWESDLNTSPQKHVSFPPRTLPWLIFLCWERTNKATPPPPPPPIYTLCSPCNWFVL